MNRLDFLKFLDDYNLSEDNFDLYRILDKTDFDELICIDLKNEKYHYIHHTSNKYYSNLYHGDFSNLKSFAENGYLHPEDSERYQKDFDLTTIRERLDKADPKGMLKGFYRIKGIDGSFIETKQLVVSGELLGSTDSLIYIYVYDNATRQEKENKQKHDRSEITGLYEGLSFFKEVRKKFKELDDKWCVVDIMIRKHSLFSDWYGVDRGNYLLTMEAELLKRYAIDNSGMAGFMGQNEFCLICPYDREKISELYASVKNLVATISSIETFIPVFGIAIYDGTCGDIREYYNRAALICEIVDYSEDEYIREYDYKIHEKNQEEYRLIYDFEQAIDAGRIEFYIQPQIRLPDKKIVGGEALARWKRRGEFVSPAYFVPILEKYNLITKLDKSLWRSVCSNIRQMIDDGITPVPVSVNVSRIDILTIDVLSYLNNLLKEFDLTPKYLHVEITESAYAENSTYISETIRKIRESGFVVLMDDFGSGYSSLNMLKNMTVDVIKLDAQFLDISEDNIQKGINIIESVVNMTKTLGIPIIVEGVEQPLQRDYLSDLGCQYMQGFFFYKPMSIADFKQLISDPEIIDLNGFVMKANQQLHIREFLDENIYSDVMLNNVIGPVAFYLWKDDNIDIIRYNQQFFELVGIDSKDFSQRISSIQDFLHPHDVDKLFEMLKYARIHHVLGSRGVIRAFRPNGETVMMSLQIYLFEERSEGTVFYVSAHDISQLDFDSSSFPGGFFRCSYDDEFEFLFVSPNFEKLTGYNQSEIIDLFDNKLINMIHPDDRERVIDECHAARGERMADVSPYRLKNKEQDYIYIAEQNMISNMYGTLCYQAVVIDINDSMKLRNQMNLLSVYLNDTIMMVHRVNGILKYEVVIHDRFMKEKLRLDGKQLENALNNGEFCKLIEGYDDSIAHSEYTERFMKQIVDNYKQISVKAPDGDVVDILVHADEVEGNALTEYVVMMHVIRNKKLINVDSADI